jgi:hypothetical protein
VVAAFDGGLLSLDEACRRYALSIEEFISWQRAFDRFGQRGLRATSNRPKLKATDLRLVEK